MKNNSGRIGILLVNLGTPDSTSVPDVRKYLREFLMDGRVIDIPFISRWFLVNCIIAPFRAPKSAKEYEKVWTDRGSPLLFHTEDLKEKLEEELDESKYTVEIAMRYQSPSIEKGLKKLQNAQVEKILVLPLFPQYASATNGSVIQKVSEVVKEWQVIPSLSFVSQFFDNDLFIEAWVNIAQEKLKEGNYDAFLFSYHGLPERQIYKASCNGFCQLNDQCCGKVSDENRFCYRAQCFETTRKIAGQLDLNPSQVYTSFQSRLGKDPWIQPYTEDILKELAQNEKKKVLAFSPAFVADCLETTIEVGEEYKEKFEELGGEQWDLVPSLNSHPTWVDCIKDLVTKNS